MDAQNAVIANPKLAEEFDVRELKHDDDDPELAQVHIFLSSCCSIY